MSARMLSLAFTSHRLESLPRRLSFTDCRGLYPSLRGLPPAEARGMLIRRLWIS